jgi:hypothetical protein
VRGGEGEGYDYPAGRIPGTEGVDDIEGDMAAIIPEREGGVRGTVCCFKEP